ncbi:MFS transporter [Pseudomonas paraeruginosa]|uniref:MFS transporter n=1 Tax=Pseudomonas aeruginosa TaxID=287 RepID=UPI00115E4029|nr:MFS transporter [Pseudomonas aeruginosa]QDL01565.1 4-hydroxybenzoate transporter PcaK [Pseudomonas aeruginosa]
MDSPSTPARPRTQAMAVANLIFAGIAAALHVGKASIALPSLQQDFGGDLAALGWIMSAFPFVGVFGGIAAGILVRRWGDRRLLAIGLAILGGASLLGASMTDFAWLLGTRFVEGLGFLIVVVAAPAVLHRITAESRRSLVFGLWSTFMAGGIALSMLVGPLLADWRADWLASALPVLLAAALLFVTVPAAAGGTAGGQRGGLGVLLRNPAISLLALSFSVYNLQFFALMTFLPVFLMQRLGVPLETAGLVGAAIVAANALGNLAAGVVLSRGVRPGVLLALTAVLMGVTGAAFFHAATPASLAVGLGFVFSAVAGMLPTTTLASAPLASPTPALTPLAIGWVMQGNYLGQVVGPLLIGLIVSRFDWSGAIGLMLGAGVAGGALGVRLLRTLGNLPMVASRDFAARPSG